MTTAAICATRELSWRPSFYRGEQYDSDLGLYYLRARYYNPSTGRFLHRDPEDGKTKVPQSLHKYLFAGGDPINRIDPTWRSMFETGLVLEEDSFLPEIMERLTLHAAKTFLCAAIDLILAVEISGPIDLSGPLTFCWNWS